jgi:hypothetical protein
MKLQSDKIGEFISGIQSKIITATDKHESFDLSSERATYQMLNYPKIFDHLCEFAENYESYHKAGDNKYRDKIITMTQKYVEKIVSDKAYRKDLNIHEFKDQVNAFVDGTLKFQKIIKRIEEDSKFEYESNECARMISMLVDAYIKIGNVFKHDLDVYMPIKTSNDGPRRILVTESALIAQSRMNTPVLHIKREGE